LAGSTEEQAQAMIDYAEEAAERVEEEAKAARAAEAEARAAAQAEAAANPAAKLFPDEEAAPARVEATKPTVESLFGPEPEEKPEEKLTAAQVFGEAPAPETKPEEQQP
jgi:hypothetical protein